VVGPRRALPRRCRCSPALLVPPCGAATQPSQPPLRPEAAPQSLALLRRLLLLVPPLLSPLRPPPCLRSRPVGWPLLLRAHCRARREGSCLQPVPVQRILLLEPPARRGRTRYGVHNKARIRCICAVLHLCSTAAMRAAALAIIGPLRTCAMLVSARASYMSTIRSRTSCGRVRREGKLA
jgi:hypothetical protein